LVIVERLREFEKEHGLRFAPSQALLKHASSGKKFYS